MPTIAEIVTNPKFAELEPSDKYILLKKYAPGDARFMALPDTDRELLTQKYSGYTPQGSPAPPTPPPATPGQAPSALGAVVEPFRRVGAGLMALPGQVAAGVRAIPQVDWRNLKLGELFSAARETYAPALPEMIGAGVGAFAGPPGLVAGPVAARLGYENLRQLLTGEPQAPLETLTRGATAAVGGGLSVVPGAVQRVAHPLRGRFAEIPGVAQAAERQGIPLTLADVTGSKRAGQMENLAGTLPGGGKVQAFQAAQTEAQAGAFTRAVEGLGPTPSRAVTGARAVEAIEGRFAELQTVASRMRAAITKTVGEEAIPATHLRATAKELGEELRRVKYAGARDAASLKLVDDISAGYQPTSAPPGAVQAVAPKLPDPLMVSDSVSKLVGRGMQPGPAGRMALEDLLRGGFAEEASVSAVNRALKEATGRTAVPLSEETITAARQTVATRPSLAPVVSKPGVGPGAMDIDQWYATQTAFGQKGHDVNILSTPERAVYQKLFKAMQEDLEAWTPARPEARAAVTRFKEFYKNNIVPFTQSAPGRLAAGKIDPEYAGRLLTKDGLTELQHVKRYAPPAIVQEIRNRGLQDLFEKGNLIDANGVFQPGNVRRVWNSIDSEVKARAFTAEQRQAFDSFALVSARIARKLTTAGGGSPSGTPLAQAPMLQAGAVFTAGTRLARATLTGNVADAAQSAGILGASLLGPRLLARWVTNPASIRKLTAAMQTSPTSKFGAAFLAEINAFREANPED